MEDRWITMQELEVELEFERGFNLAKRVFTKLMLELLTTDQNQIHLEISHRKC